MINDEFIFSEALSFEEKALGIFNYQFKFLGLYRAFCQNLGIAEANSISDISQIPLMPIDAFKLGKVVCFDGNNELLFRSSGTTLMSRAQHFVKYKSLYETSIVKGIQHFFPEFENAVWLGFTPAYEDNPNSSLIWMIQYLIGRDSSGFSRFLPTNKSIDTGLFQELPSNRPIVIFGAAFGLVDAVVGQIECPSRTYIIETGGMKTFRKEMTRNDLHENLMHSFGIPATRIYSEYGMAELLSQAYRRDDSGFQSPPWMRLTVRRSDNPSKEAEVGENGRIGVIDLANKYSCSFILTADRGVNTGIGVEILGRTEGAELRGCNFLLENEL